MDLQVKVCYFSDDDASIKPVSAKKHSDNDMYMRLGLLLGDGARRSKGVIYGNLFQQLKVKYCANCPLFIYFPKAH